MSAEVIRATGLSLQVCVPHAWIDDEILAFAEEQNSCGTEAGWAIRQAGNTTRAKCATKTDHIHVVLDA